jgi:DNA mismatch repair protein MutS
MQIDSTTFRDLSIFHTDEASSVFHRLDFTRTSEGKEYLYRYFKDPHDRLEEIEATQSILRHLSDHLNDWPESITNGTLLVIEKFLDYHLEPLPSSQDPFNAWLYRIVNGPDFSLAKYSVGHLSDLVKGMRKLTEMLDQEGAPARLRIIISDIKRMLRHATVERMIHRPAGQPIGVRETVTLARFFHHEFRQQTQALIQCYGQLDAWYSMAVANERLGLSFPEFVRSDDPLVDARGLFHLLLPKPVPYDVRMDPDTNFMFLTGANMAGKSTFIKSVGIAVFLAHLGMGVPASAMRLTLFEGILSNINVMDDIIRGESYFFNEVQRIRHTVERISDGRRWLVLIDELFKGTNIQDAMKCSATVIRGLIRIRKALFILSTHLYEIGEELKPFHNICFRYFETGVIDDQLVFSYQLREGISNDRIGYLILKREKVTDLLERL